MSYQLGESRRPTHPLALALDHRRRMPLYHARSSWLSRPPRAPSLDRTPHTLPMLASPGFGEVGFSLKPPKKLRKAFRAIGHAIAVDVKNAPRAVEKFATGVPRLLAAGGREALKVAPYAAAVAGGILAAPIVLPALAHGAVAAGGLLARGAGALERGAASVVRGVEHALMPHGTIKPDQIPIDMGPDNLPAPGPTSPTPATVPMLAPPAAQAAGADTSAPATLPPFVPGSTVGPLTEGETAAAMTPEGPPPAAGPSPALLAGAGLLALVVLTAARPKRKGR